MNESPSGIKVLDVDHLGIVARIIDEMEMVEEVNKIVGIKEKESLRPGQVMKAIILNALGFLRAHYTYSRKLLSKKQQNI